MSADIPSRMIALLRAINVGGHVVTMDRLRGLFESLGLSHVETFIASVPGRRSAWAPTTKNSVCTVAGCERWTAKP